MPAGCNNLIGMITDLYGLIDFIMQFKLSWVQFLKRLSLTDLGQDSEKMYCIIYYLKYNYYVRKQNYSIYKYITRCT